MLMCRMDAHGIGGIIALLRQLTGQALFVDASTSSYE